MRNQIVEVWSRQRTFRADSVLLVMHIVVQKGCTDLITGLGRVPLRGAVHTERSRVRPEPISERLGFTRPRTSHMFGCPLRRDRRSIAQGHNGRKGTWSAGRKKSLRRSTCGLESNSGA